MNITLNTICYILALYGLIILVRKLILSKDDSRKKLGLQFYIEPFQSHPFVELNTNSSSPIQLPDQPYIDLSNQTIPSLQMIQQPNLCRSNCNDKCKTPFRGGFKVNEACMDDCISYC